MATGTPQRKIAMEDHGDMPIEDFTHGLYRNILSIKVAMWILVALEFGKYFIW